MYPTMFVLDLGSAPRRLLNAITGKTDACLYTNEQSNQPWFVTLRDIWYRFRVEQSFQSNKPCWM